MKKFALLPTLLFAFFFGPKITSAQDWPNLNRFTAANEILAGATIEENRIVFMGNSITEGWGKDSYSFFTTKGYINRGIGGQTTPQMLIRFRPDVVDLQPKVVVILAGINDIAENTGPSTIKMIADNIKSMAEIAKAANIQVVLSSVLPAADFPWRPGLEPALKVVALNEQLESYAKANDLVYLDYFSAMVDDNHGLLEAYTYDGIHPNNKGYEIMKPLAEEAILKALMKK